MSTQIVAPARTSSLRSVRARTLQLFDLATSEEVLQSEPMPGFRPLLWHLAHIGVYQNYWVLQRCAGQPSINPTYDVHFDPIQTPREEAKILPTRDKIEAYLRDTLERVESFLTSAPRANDGRLSPAYALDLVLEHELQHQETIAFVMQSLALDQKRPGPPPPTGGRAYRGDALLVPATKAKIGAWASGFAYDNELPRHEVAVAPFYIDRDLTTNAEYAAFVADRGYSRREFWSAQGWAWKEQDRINAPLYWSDTPWTERSFFAQIPLREDAPVTGICFFEAQAYATYAGKRLPTEPEWEIAAAWDPAARQMRRYVWGNDDVEPAQGVLASWGTTPVGRVADNASPLGMRDAIGNVWQWTSSEFRGYPGFAAYPYPEYSQVWFDGDHVVLRGGSWFTDRSLTRTSFRNFYRKGFRQAFSGIRCARDAQ